MGGLILFANDIIGGQGVYVARSMYESIEPRIYEDGAICAGMGSSDKTEQQVNDMTSKCFSLQPNPSTGILTLACDNVPEQITQVEIYNTLGQLLTTITLPAYQISTNIDLSSLNAGIYFVQFKQNGTLLQTEKLSLIR